VLVLTPAFLDDVWSELPELLASHAQVMGRDGRLVPLVREPCQLPLRIDFLVSLDCTREERWPGAVARLREHLRRDQRPPEPEAIRCPYPGLVAFGQAQAGVFFGRAGEVGDLHRRLPRQGLVMVIGPSGSGKTSLVFAGLLPRLETAAWAVRTLRPGAGPMAARFKEQVLVVWDLPQRRKVAELRAGPSAYYAGDNDTDVALSPDGRLLAYARNDAASFDAARRLDRVAVWDLPNRREVGAFDTSEEIDSLAFHPAGVLAIGYEDRIELRDTGSLALRQTLRSPRSTAGSLSFSPDGRWLTTIGSAGAHLWEVGDPSTVPVLAGALVDSDESSLSLSTDVAFSPDGRLLAVADGAPEVILWDLDERSWRETLCSLADRDFSDAERHRFFPGGQAEPTCGS
jgi:energy-coupling factor transporter ATP-binding protein EcfA2